MDIPTAEIPFLVQALLWAGLLGGLFYFLLDCALVHGLLRLRRHDSGETPMVSVVVSARNEEATLENCLAHLFSQSCPKDRYEVLVADDRSTDKTDVILRRWQEPVFRRKTADAMPLAEACRAYRARFGAWPDSPDKLAPFLDPMQRASGVSATGCHLAENGDFLLVLQRGRQLPVFARRFRADGTESWEILAANHPLPPPGAKRWKHPFPHTD